MAYVNVYGEKSIIIITKLKNETSVSNTHKIDH